MASTTENLYTGDGSTVLYSFTFPYIETSHVKVSLDGVDTTEYFLANATTVEFDTAPADQVAIKIYRNTDIENVSAAFFPGSAIRAQDLNDNFEQSLFVVQEAAFDNSQSAADSAAALSTAQAADAAATSALTQSGQALTDAAQAQADAAQAGSDASQASSDASAAQTSASAAQAAAQDAADAVQNAAVFTPVANVAAIPSSPVDDTRVKVVDATGIDSFSPLAGLPVGPTYDSGIYVEIIYQSEASSWVFVDYQANSPDERYLNNLGPDDDLDVGNITATGTLTAGRGNFGSPYASGDGVNCFGGGGIYIRQDGANSSANVLTFLNGGSATSDRKFAVYGNGSITADGKIEIGVNSGYTTGGELTSGTQSAFTAFSSSSLNTDLYKFNIYEGDTDTIKAGITAGGRGEFTSIKFPDGSVQTSASSGSGGGGGGGGTTINYNGASAWGNVNSSGALVDGLNVASVTRASAGTYDIVFTTPMPNADYAINATATGPATFGRVATVTGISATGFTLQVTSANDVTEDRDFYFTVHATNALPPMGGTGTDAWGVVQIDGTVDASFNIDSVTKTSDGHYDVVFTTAMPSANYAVTGNPTASGDTLCTFHNQSATGFTAQTFETSGQRYLDQSFSFTVNATNATLPLTLDQETVLAAAQNPGASAWVNVSCDSSGPQTILAGMNVSSVERLNTGQYKVTFANAMPDANYSAVGSAAQRVVLIGQDDKTPNSFIVESKNASNQATDTSYFQVQVFATNALPPKGGTGTDAWGCIAADKTILAGFNVASVASSSGIITVTFTTAMPAANYAVNLTAEDPNDIYTPKVTGRTTTGFSCAFYSSTGAAGVIPFNFTVNATNATLPDTFTEAQIQGVIDAGPQGIAKAWVSFNGSGTVSIRDSFNVDSVTDNGTGEYTVNFTTPMANANYAAVASCSPDSSPAQLVAVMNFSGSSNSIVAPTTSACRFSTTSLGASSDAEYVYFAVFGS